MDPKDKKQSDLEWLEVNSSILEAVQYDEESRTLRIRFRKGTVYEYQNVPPNLVRSMLRAESVGSFFTRYIKPNYRYRKLTTG